MLTAQSTIIERTVSGELTPSEAQAMVGLVEMRRRAAETVELEQRLAAIEARLAAVDGGDRVLGQTSIMQLKQLGLS